MNPLINARTQLRAALETTGRKALVTPPEIITPPVAVIIAQAHDPGQRYGTLLGRWSIDLIVAQHADFETTQDALDNFTVDSLAALINAGFDLEQVSQPFNIQDTEGALFPAVTLTITQELTL